MRSAGLFIGLMATGVLMVLIYIWSGESIVALVLSIITLFAVLGVWQWQPWALDGPELGRSGRPIGADDPDGLVELEGTDDGHGRAGPCWRNPFDITWDDRGLSGVPVGSQAPQMWVWSQIDDIGYGWHTLDQDVRNLEERLAFRLDFPDVRNREEPVQAWIMFGPDQQPEGVQRQAREAWREYKVTRSRFHGLSPVERTELFADHLASQKLDLGDSPGSPELLYQEVRRALLDGGELCRLVADASFDHILDCFDEMLAANGADLISEHEADDLAAMNPEGGRSGDAVAALHRSLDWVVEQRGYRVVFIDQVGEQRRDDYLIGLVPAASADDWDGQTVGSGSARVTLDRPDHRR